MLPSKGYFLFCNIYKQSKEKGLTAREKRDMEFQELLKKYESEENL